MNKENQEILDDILSKDVVDDEDMLMVAENYGYRLESRWTKRMNATKFLLQNQYKPKYTAWIIDELIQEDDELLEYLIMKNEERVSNE
jgi:hypothetical protein|tara:strand:+ start:6145 stop:6408 length:264 start_codon:yes stop_codon:yes gene_type:complete